LYEKEGTKRQKVQEDGAGSYYIVLEEVLASCGWIELLPDSAAQFIKRDERSVD
jgi:hypothetical protein